MNEQNAPYTLVKYQYWLLVKLLLYRLYQLIEFVMKRYLE